MMPFVSLDDLKLSGYEIPNPLLWPGYSWDGLDLYDYEFDRWDGLDWDWDRFEYPGLREWDSLDDYGLDFDAFDTLDRSWDELEEVYSGFAGYWSAATSNRNGDFGVALVDEFDWDQFDDWDRSFHDLDERDYAWDDLEGSDVPELDIYFTEDHSSAGLTFRFATLYEEWAEDVEVTWYDKDGLFLGYIRSRPEEILHFAQRKVEGYRHINIKFHKTNLPYSHVKLTTIEFGVAQALGGNDIISASTHEEISSTSSQVHINTLDCKIQNDESNFYVLNTVGVFSLLQERQTLEVIELVDGEQIPMGTYYLASMENESKSIVRIQAVDLMGVIDKSDFVGGVYNNITVGNLIAEIMESAKASYELDPSLANLRISGYIPICSHREALQQVTFAIGAIATASRSDRIRIVSPKAYPTEVIPVSKKFYRKPVHLNELVTATDVTSFTYGNGNEIRELLNDTLEAGIHEAPFPEPIEASTVRTTHGTIVEVNANRAILSLDRRYDIVLTGYPYVIQNRSYKRETGGLPSTTSPNIQYVDSATLVSPDRAQVVADRLYEYAQKRHTHTFGMVNEGQAPGDVIQVQHADGGQIIGTVEVIDTDLTKGFRSDITVNFAYLIERTKFPYAREPAKLYTGKRIGVF